MSLVVADGALCTGCGNTSANVPCDGGGETSATGVPGTGGGATSAIDDPRAGTADGTCSGVGNLNDAHCAEETV